MTALDTIVDAFEEQIAKEGVLHCDLHRFIAVDLPQRERGKVLVEMLRVWMEHRWQAGHPVSTEDCLNQFPNDRFSKADIDALTFEEERQRGIVQRATLSNRLANRSLDDLPQAGQRWGDFELLCLLGTGAFAKVYLARQHGLAGRLVALKLTFQETQESQWLATLQHSAIVPVYSTHKIEPVYAICMPYLGNTTLADLLREVSQTTVYSKHSWWRSSKSRWNGARSSLLSTIQQRHNQIYTVVDSVSREHGTAASGSTKRADISKALTIEAKGSEEGHSLSSKQWPTNTSSFAARCLSQCEYVQAICWVGAQLADGLSYSHCNGIVHSDVKPANILLASDGQPRLLDFNVSYRNVDSTLITADTPIGGTIAYMSPEHLRALKEPTMLDGRSDVYSLGVVLYQMLTLRLPKTELDSPGEPCSHQPNQWNSAVSPGLSAIVSKCLEHEPDKRYASARELNEDLTAQFNHEPLRHQSQPSQIEVFTKWCLRHPRLSSSVTIASMATLLVAALVATIALRGAALERADWTHRLDLLRQRLPNSMAMLSAMQAVPELESEIVCDLDDTMQLIATKRGANAEIAIDPRWSDSGSLVDEALRAALRDVVWTASQRTWHSAPKWINAFEMKAQQSDASHRKSIDQMLKGQWQLAIPALKERVQLSPKDFVAWCLLGNCRSAMMDFGAAQQAYTACIAIQPMLPISHFLRGLSRLNDSQYELATEDFEQVSKLAPNWYGARLNRALAFQKMGRFDNAIQEIDRAIDSGHPTLSLFRLRGDLNLALGKTKDANADYQSALQCEPITEAEWIDRGLIRLSIDPKEAIHDFEQALSVNPLSANAHQKLAYVYSELLHEPDLSLEHLAKLIELEPAQWSHRAGRAVVFARAGRADLALDDLKILESSHSKDAITQYQIACAYSLLASWAESANATDAVLSYERSAFRWTIRAIDTDPSIAAIMTTDPDVVWLRGKPQYDAIQNALKTLQLNQP